MLTGKDVLQKELLEKDATIKRFEFSPLDSELEKPICILEKQYQKIDKFFEPNKKMSTRLPVFLAQIKAADNIYILKT